MIFSVVTCFPEDFSITWNTFFSFGHHSRQSLNDWPLTWVIIERNNYKLVVLNIESLFLTFAISLISSLFLWNEISYPYVIHFSKSTLGTFIYNDLNLRQVSDLLLVWAKKSSKDCSTSKSFTNIWQFDLLLGKAVFCLEL